MFGQLNMPLRPILNHYEFYSINIFRPHNYWYKSCTSNLDGFNICMKTYQKNGSLLLFNTVLHISHVL